MSFFSAFIDELKKLAQEPETGQEEAIPMSMRVGLPLGMAGAGYGVGLGTTVAYPWLKKKITGEPKEAAPGKPSASKARTRLRRIRLRRFR